MTILVHKMAERDYLFVYGTLRKEIFSSARVLVAQHSAFVGEATFRGRLCDLGGYAGQDGARTQFNSSLIESWGSKREQSQAQSGFQPI